LRTLFVSVPSQSFSIVYFVRLKTISLPSEVTPSQVGASLSHRQPVVRFGSG
jgi:hypothetical protein